MAHDKMVWYRIQDEDDLFKLTVYDPGVDPEKEETLVEGLKFTNIADLLQFMSRHYPKSQEEML